MDLAYLRSRHAVSLKRAVEAVDVSARAAHAGLARSYLERAERIEAELLKPVHRQGR